MNSKLVTAFVTLLLLLAVKPVQAQREMVQWSPDDGVSVRQGWHIEWFRGGEARDFGELAGETAVVWSDTRDGDRGVYTQVIDLNGETKFGENGLLVVDSTGRQEDPGIWPDPVDGGWFVAWEDFDIWFDDEGDAHGDSLGDIYCTKIDADGNRIWGDTERGVPVCTVNGIQESVRIVQDGQGGCIIAWLDKRGGDAGDLYAQHINSDGEPTWQANGIAIVAEPGTQTSHTADIDGQGGMIIGWRDGREVGDNNIWVQRINPNGDLLWGNGDGIMVCNHQANQESPKLCPDGQGGAFITWVDDRNVQETNKDIYAQRVNRDGQLLWGEPDEGEPLVVVNEEQLGNRVVISAVGEAIVMWEDKRGNGQEYDIYAMKISGQNAMEKLWDPDEGVPISVVERNQQQARLYPDGQGGAFFVWEDERDGGFPEIDIWAHRFNNNGDPVWAENGVPVCRADGNQNSPLIRRDASGGCFITWAELRTGSTHIFGQRLRAESGEPIWQVDGKGIATGIGLNATNPRVLSNGDNQFAAYWTDGRFGGKGTFPFVLFGRNTMGGVNVDLYGEENGFPVVAIGDDVVGGGITPKAVLTEDNEIYIVWQDQRHNLNRPAIFSQKIAHDGDNYHRLWGENGIRVAEFEYDQNGPKICLDGQGGIIVAWRGLTDDYGYDIYMQRLDSEGQAMWGAEGIKLTEHEDDESVEDLVPDGNGGAVIVWNLAEWDYDDDLLAAHVNSNGEVTWGDGAGISIAHDFNKQRDADLVSVGDLGYFVAWVDGRDDENGQPQNDIYVQLINADGATQWDENGSLLCGFDAHQERPVVAVTDDNLVWVAWEDHRFTGNIRGRDIYIQKLNPQAGGETIFQRDGIPVCSADRDQVNPEMIFDDGDGVWLTWEDNRSGIWSDIYSIRLDADGQPVPVGDGGDANGEMICGAYHKQEGPNMSLLETGGDQGVVIVWEDKRATGKEELSDVYIQHAHTSLLSVRDRNRPYHPIGYALESVYPNPFNSQAVITFVTPREGDVNLMLYDVSGRLVQEISRDAWTAGRHLLLLDGSNLSTGSYFVRLEVGDVMLERRVNLVK